MRWAGNVAVTGKMRIAVKLHPAKLKRIDHLEDLDTDAKIMIYCKEK
jgi:hypothetical protein